MDFSSSIINWYQRNQRPLPWRSTRDPYHIWLSEVILQQTRVAQGLPYYLRFTELFPDVYALANASEDLVLKTWQGLGYYSRARNLHKAARQIVQEFQGKFPDSAAALKKITGIGDYTSAAIASFCFNEPAAVVDGNVVRVLSRYFGISESFQQPAGRKVFNSTAAEVLNLQDPATHNQAIMEFGALQCVPKNPDCNICPLRDSCYAFNKDQVSDLPVPKKKVKITERAFTYYLIHDGENMLVRKRSTGDIWEGLYEFVLVEGDCPVAPVGGRIKELASDRHVLTHQVIHGNLFLSCVKNLPSIDTYYAWPLNKLDELGLPRLISRWMENPEIRSLIPCKT